MAPTTIAPPEDADEAQLAASRASCQAQGGTWDSVRNICILPERRGSGDAGGGATEERQAAARQISPKVAFKADKTSSEAFKETTEREKAISDAEALGFTKGEEPEQQLQEEQSIIPEGFTSKTTFPEARELFGMTAPEFGAAKRELFAQERPTEKAVLDIASQGALALLATYVGGAVVGGLGEGGATGATTASTASNIVTKSPLKSPGVLKATLEAAKKHPIIAGAVGYKLSSLGGDAVSISKDVALRDIKKLDTLLGKMGEEITAFDAIARNGYYIDEEGKVIEYTTKDARKDLEDAYEFLEEAERKMQEANIYQKFFLLTSGEDLNIQGEIDKLKTEVKEETSNIIATQLEQPETLTAANDFFRRLEAEGYNV